MTASVKDGSRGENPGSSSRYGSVRIPCMNCGAELRRHPSTLANANGKAFCNRACFTAWNKGRPRKPRADRGQRRGEWIEKPCAYCGKPVARRLTDSRPRHFCNRGCAGRLAKQEGRTGRPPEVGRRTVHAEGYVLVFVGKDHPMANARGDCMEHRLVMADTLGRPLLPTENVHHRNGDKADNRRENLELWITKQPKGQRPPELLAWAREILALYEPLEALLSQL